MNGTLGRDKVWNDQIWSEIDKAVREEMGRIRVAQKVFPTTVVNNVLPVATARAVAVGQLDPEFPVSDEFRPFFEISTSFRMTHAQVDGEENQRLALAFGRFAACVIAGAEDAILFWGRKAIPSAIHLTNPRAIPPGFVAEAQAYPPATPIPDPPPSSPPCPADALGDILTGVADAMAALNSRSQPGPFALFLSPKRYAQTFSPTTFGFLQTPGDAIKNVVTGGIYAVNSLTDDKGILASLGGEPAKIVLGTDATTALTYIDEKGTYFFRVFERIQLVVQDGRAFQALEIPPRVLTSPS